MTARYYTANRRRFYENMDAGALLVLFSGEEIRKTSDEYYPFFAERNFVYLTGLGCKQAVLLVVKEAENSVREMLYILPPDAMPSTSDSRQCCMFRRCALPDCETASLRTTRSPSRSKISV